jgi:ABC-type glycerol-3-phosphate transport system substrate-binding protein
MQHIEPDGTIAQGGFIPWLGAGIHLWIVAHGADIYDERDQKWTLRTQPASRALAWYQQYVKRLGTLDAISKFTAPFTGNVTPLGSGKLAMQVVGDWAPITQYDKDSPLLKYGVGKIPVAPGVPEGTNNVIGSDTFVLPTGVKHPEESMRFLLYMDSHEPVLAWCLGEANVPPTPTMANDPKYVNGFSYGRVLVDMARPGLVHPYPSSPIYSDAIGFLNAAVNKVRNGEASPDDALAEAQRLTEQKQQEFRAQRPGW